MSWREIADSYVRPARTLRRAIARARANAPLTAGIVLAAGALGAIASLGQRGEWVHAVLAAAIIVLLALIVLLQRRAHHHRRLCEGNEHELRQSERRLQGLLRNCSDMILVVAPDATVMYTGGSARELFGDEEAAGVNLAEFVAEEDVPALHELSQTTDAASIELEMRYPEDCIHLGEVSATGLIDDSAWWGVVLNIRDISEKRKLELERAKTARLQERVTAEREREELQARLLHAQRLESTGATTCGSRWPMTAAESRPSGDQLDAGRRDARGRLPTYLPTYRRRRGRGRRRAVFNIPRVNRDELRALQAPLKDRYRDEPGSALVTLSASGELGDGVSCSVQTGRALAEAGLHPASGGDGSLLCSGDMLLEALVACAGVTLRAVATSLGIAVESGRVHAEGDLDFRGTLGVDREAPVGFEAIRLSFELDTDADEEQLATLLRLTERYCVVYQTLAAGPELSASLAVA
jgi:PAS domain S-box-containing protein